MDKQNQNKIYEGALELLRVSGTRFNVDDLANKIHMSKKTIYRQFPSKTELSEWIYRRCFLDFDQALAEFSAKPNIPSRQWLSLLNAYSDILVLADEATFNRYSLDQSLHSLADGEFSKRRKALVSALKESPLSDFLNHPSFLPALESSLFSFSKADDRVRLIADYSNLLGDYHGS